MVSQFRKLDELRRYLDEHNKMYMFLLYVYGVSEKGEGNVGFKGSIKAKGRYRGVESCKKALFPHASTSMGSSNRTGSSSRSGPCSS